jgi:hypothetical protein
MSGENWRRRWRCYRRSILVAGQVQRLVLIAVGHFFFLGKILLVYHFKNYYLELGYNCYCSWFHNGTVGMSIASLVKVFCSGITVFYIDVIRLRLPLTSRGPCEWIRMNVENRFESIALSQALLNLTV